MKRALSLLAALVILAGCQSTADDPSVTDANTDTTATTGEITAADASDEAVDPLEKFVVMETPESITDLYRCRILDRDGNISREYENAREIHAYFADEDVIAVYVQAGTGIYTRWYEFYNTELDKWSDTFDGHVAVRDGLVCHLSGINCITVEELFDDGEIFLETSEFDPPLSQNTVEPILGVSFTENGVRVDYLTGEEMTETYQEFELYDEGVPAKPKTFREKLEREIDRPFEDAMNNDSTTLGMRMIQDEYSEKWQAAADECYAVLIEYDKFDYIPEEGAAEKFRDDLAAMKAAWEEYFRVEMENYSGVMNTLYYKGSVVPVHVAGRRMELTKEWAMELAGFCDGLGIHPQ